ncbi:mucin-binding protein, partial [Limosilactobacillus mucosae]|uniref:mucin-binding protein n=1 Tax=Limosilactobacillus mucosae TaxID=97478 RepID=UPI003995B2D4
MYSKNNKYMQEQKSANRAQRFSLRKLSIGTVSVLLGTLMFFSNGQVSADTTNTDTSADTTNVTSTANDTSASAVTLNSASTAASDANNSAVASSAATSAQTATAASASTASQSAAATSTADSSQAASTASVATMAASSAATDNAASAEGKITDEGKAKGLTDSDVTPEMSDANGASLVADNSNIPSGYKADPTEGRYTVGIVSLGGDFDKWVSGDASKFKSYNGENNTNYYLRFSTSKNATDGTYDSTVYAQVVDATTDTVKWERALTPNSGAVKVNNGTDGFELSSLVAGVTQYYELTYTNTKIGNASTSRITINPNNGTLTAVTVYSNGKAISAGSATPGTYTSVLFPATGVIKTEYIAQDAAGNETTLATYEEGGRQGYTYTISDSRVIKGYDLISSPSTTTGILGKTYNVGDVYAGGNLELSDQLQLARVYVATSEYGDAKVEVRVALKKDADGNAITISSLNDSNIWKTILSTASLAPGATASDGNYGDGASYYINGTDGIKYITDAGFTEEQLAGYKSHLAVIILANGLTQGQEPAKYYYAPQGQVRINYVTSDGTAIQAPVSAYENSGANTSYDVTGSTYQPQTITVNGKTYRYVKSDKSMGTAGTTEVNGYTYNVTPSDATGTIKSTTVNDVYYVYEQVTYHTEAESKDVTRTIEYYDSVTGEAIPADLEKTVTQTATLNRNKILDDKNNFIGYGTISEDGSSYTLDDSWKVADQSWTKQDSADLSDYGYTAPDRASVAAVTVDGDTTNVTEKVYYGHQTVPVTPENPGTPGEPINPKGNVEYPDGVSKDDLTSTVTRTINYVDEDGNAVNGSPDGTSSYVQTAEFTRTAILDKVTGKILGYDTDNDGKVDTESADRAWTPTEKTLEAVKSADPSSVGYDKVDKSTVESLLVTPGQADTTVTVTYSNNQVSGTIKYIDVTTGVELDSDTLPTGKVGSKINYTTEDKIKSYEDQGYELVSSDFTDGSQVYEKEGNDFVVKLKHKTQTITPNDPNPVTPGEPINPDDPNSPVYGEETDRKNLVKDASQTIHYVGAGDDTPTDNVVTQKDAFTRTVTIDKVTGKVLSYTDWTGEKTFNTVDTPVVEGYHADKKVAGGLTATVDNPDVEETVTYAPNGKLVPVDPNGNPIPGADTPTYPTDPNDPTKVVPNEPIPDVPNWTPVDPSPVTPSNPGEDTPVPYTQNQY